MIEIFLGFVHALILSSFIFSCLCSEIHRSTPMPTISNSEAPQLIITIGESALLSWMILRILTSLPTSFSSVSYYTHEMAFNYGNYDRASDRYLERPRARIGIMMSFFQTSELVHWTSFLPSFSFLLRTSTRSLSPPSTLDGEWRAAEGVGLTYGYSRQFTENVGSGRVESYAVYLFRPAKVEVFGSSSKGFLNLSLKTSHSFFSSSPIILHKCKSRQVWSISSCCCQL
jgi:hypothetical protein